MVSSLRLSHHSTWELNELLYLQSVTLHTSHGDLKIEVFCEAVPKAAENFLALCASGSYDGCLWHRCVVITLSRTTTCY